MAEEKTLNGLRPDKIKAITDSMRDDPEVLKAVTGPWNSRVVWQGGFKAKCFVRADADEKTLREIWQAAVDGSPVTQTVVRPTKLETEFEKV